MSLFDQVPTLPPDNGFALLEAFRADPFEKKVNLCPGIYQDESSQTWTLPSVKKAREILLGNPDLKHDISPLTGHPAFVSAARRIAFQDTLESRHVTSMQTIAGTGANHIIAQLLSDVATPKTVWLSDPSWENHTKIWNHVNSGIEQRFYPYYNTETFELNDAGILATLQEHAKKGDVIVLQACAHNPTGVDPSQEFWKKMAKLCHEKEIFPVFDLAYQGFATGDVLNDGWAIRYFAGYADGDIEFAVAQSFSKTFGLYGERTGALHVVTRSEETANKVVGALKKICRAELTSTPGFGAKIVGTIMQDKELETQWYQDLRTMSNRLQDMRKKLYDQLTKRNTPGNWAHFLSDIGMFSMTGLSPAQLATLQDTYHIYMLPMGRLSFTGLTSSNVEYVAEAIHTVCSV